MTKFEVVKSYQGVIARRGAVRNFDVVKRTPKFITIVVKRTPKFITIKGEMVPCTEKIRVKEGNGVETEQYDCAWLHY